LITLTLTYCHLPTILFYDSLCHFLSHLLIHLITLTLTLTYLLYSTTQSTVLSLTRSLGHSHSHTHTHSYFTTHCQSLIPCLPMYANRVSVLVCFSVCTNNIE